ncbi:MAG: helix-hairpin-helix domain-containing protein [Chloroflexi bacterium]|nr:helix-hairpin-helix domain-containing protein [Chloroflexota bacterium]
MDTERKLEMLVAGAAFDVCGYCGDAPPAQSPLRFIHNAALPGGGAVPLFKVLQTNVCVNDCAYCVNQVGRDGPRSAFQPEELSRVFMELHRRKLVQGLFLTSAIAGNAARSMEPMLQTVEILRRRCEYRGYVHLKILPGAGPDYVETACRLASRVSVNIEAPTARHLARLSSRKNIFEGILEPMRWVRQITARDERLAPAGQTTQFVVGAAGESDREILATTAALYREVKLRRAYFSAFHPVSHSRLEGVGPAPPLREHRLYQADWLMRVYGFADSEVALAFGQNGNLALKTDPKLIIARKQPWLFPVDINTAGYEELLHVPGIGPQSAHRIIAARREHSIDSLTQLKKMRVVTRHAAPFIWFQGMLAAEKQASFLPLLEEESEETPSLASVVA